MSNDMHYKGYEADIRYSECDGCFVGKVKGLSRRVAITFEGESVAELKADFQAAVDDYLALCASLGEEPERPYSGRFVVRMDSELHSAADRKSVV